MCIEDNLQFFRMNGQICYGIYEDVEYDIQQSRVIFPKNVKLQRIHNVVYYDQPGKLIPLHNSQSEGAIDHAFRYFYRDTC